MSTVDPLANAADTQLWAERTGHRQFIGRNSRGGEVKIADISQDGAFTPGELLKVALAACAGFSAEPPLSRRLGEDFEFTVRVGGLADAAENRYAVLNEVLELDLSALSAEEVARLVKVTERAVATQCTVGRTLEAGAEVTLEIPVPTAE